jgi:hypothetical protein
MLEFRAMLRARAFVAGLLVLGLAGPAMLAASGRAESCAMCAERCCCKPPDGSGMRGACRLSRPCAAGERNTIAPLVLADPAVLDAAVASIAAPPPASGHQGIASPMTFDRTASPPVPPPRA